MKDRYAELDTDTFHGILEGIVAGMSADEILAIPGVYDVLQEELNNDVLALWEQDHPDDDAPEVGDLVFNPRHGSGEALPSPYGRIVSVEGREGIQTYTVVLDDEDTYSVEFYDSAWWLSEGVDDDDDDEAVDKRLLGPGDESDDDRYTCTCTFDDECECECISCRNGDHSRPEGNDDDAEGEA